MSNHLWFTVWRIGIVIDHKWNRYLPLARAIKIF